MPKKRDESLIGSVFSYLTVIGLTVGSSANPLSALLSIGAYLALRVVDGWHVSPRTGLRTIWEPI